VFFQGWMLHWSTIIHQQIFSFQKFFLLSSYWSIQKISCKLKTIRGFIFITKSRVFILKTFLFFVFQIFQKLISTKFIHPHNFICKPFSLFNVFNKRNGFHIIMSLNSYNSVQSPKRFIQKHLSINKCGGFNFETDLMYYYLLPNVIFICLIFSTQDIFAIYNYCQWII
jgi:hypothetical protein